MILDTHTAKNPEKCFPISELKQRHQRPHSNKMGEAQYKNTVKIHFSHFFLGNVNMQSFKKNKTVHLGEWSE